MVLSIIILTRNEVSRIGTCLDSILTQVDPFMPMIEVIIVDGASTDGTQDVVRKYMNRYTCVHMCRCDKYGYSYQRNRGVEYAQGEWVLYVSGDTILAKNCIKKVWELMRNYDVIQGTIVNKKTEKFSSELLAQIHSLLYKKYLMNPVENFSTVLVCIRKSYILKCPFSEEIAALEDKEWMLRATCAFPNMRYYHSKTMLIYHKLHENILTYCKKVLREAMTVGYLYEQYYALADFFHWSAITRNTVNLLLWLILLISNIILKEICLVHITICMILVWLLGVGNRYKKKYKGIWLLFLLYLCVAVGFARGYIKAKVKK